MTGITADNSSLSSSGGNVTFTVTGTNLKSVTGLTVKSATLTGTISPISSDTSDTVSVTLPNNTSSAPVVYTFKPYINGSKQSFSTTITVAGQTGNSGGAVNTPASYANGAAITPTVTMDSSGHSSSIISSNDITIAVGNAVGAGGSGVATFDLKAPANSSSMELTIPKEGFATLSDKSVNKLVVTNNSWKLAFDAKTFDSINAQATGDVKLSVATVSESNMTAEQKAAANNRPVYEFGLTSSGKAISALGGKVEVTLPYKLQAGEEANAVAIYYMDANGKLQIVPNCKYEATTGTISFSTTHFSLYVIGYNSLKFADIPADYWGREYIEQAAARGFISGVGGGKFEADRGITRTEFVQMIVNVMKPTLYTSTANPFADVSSDKWYYQAIGSAQQAGYLKAFTDENFDPQKPVTREEMAAILSAVISQSNITTSSTKTVQLNAVFSDYGNIDNGRLSDVELCYNMKLMRGTGDDKFDPKGVSTRAQAAVVQMRLLDVLTAAK